MNQKLFVDTRTGQVVKAMPCLSSCFPGGAGFTLIYPDGSKANISRDMFATYYQPLWPQPQGAA